MRPHLSLILCLTAALAAVHPLAAQERLSPEQLVQLQKVGGLALSSDGKGLLFTVRSTDLAANKGSSRVLMLPLFGGAKAESVGAGTSPAWVVGSILYAVKDKAGLRVVPLLEGKSRTIALPDGATNILWSSDGRTIAFTKNVLLDPPVTAAHEDLPQANARAYEDLMVRHWDHWTDGTYSHLFVLDTTQDGEPLDLMAGERVHTPLPPFGGAEHIAWSPDGKELCYTARRVENPESSTDSQLWIVPRQGGAHRCITAGNPGYDTEPVYSPDGKWIAYSSMARAGFESDKNRLMLHDRKTGENRELLRKFDASPHGVTWSPDSKRLFFTIDTAGTTQVYTTSLPSGKALAFPLPVTKGRHSISSLQVVPDGNTLYALRTSMERPAEVVKIDVPTGKITQLTDVNGDVYANLDLPVIDAEWFEATDGGKIHAWIVKPPGFDPKKKYPFVLYCQGGPQSMVGQSFSFRWNFHLMAAQGYVIAGVNRRGLPGFGQKWNDEISRDWGGQAMKDLLTVCDEMQNRPYIDRDRSAAIGASFGGYTVYWLMGNGGDRFACMLSHCGVFNLESMYLATEELFFVNHDLGGPFWASPEIAADYRRFSPHRFIKNWKTPLMVITGERDFRVPYDQSLQAFTAAQLQGVESRLLVFPEESHWVLSPQSGVLWHREFYGWLARFCKK